MTRACLLASSLLFSACSRSTSQAETKPDAGETGLSQRGTAVLETTDGREFRVAVEIASNEEDRRRGLMFRRSLPEMGGMVFVFPEQSEHHFWMKNTLIPLDMLFVDETGRILGCVENAEPLSTRSRGVTGESRMVLEVNGGWCSRHGIAPGDRLRLEGTYRLE